MLTGARNEGFCRLRPTLQLISGGTDTIRTKLDWNVTNLVFVIMKSYFYILPVTLIISPKKETCTPIYKALFTGNISFTIIPARYKNVKNVIQSCS